MIVINQDGQLVGKVDKIDVHIKRVYWKGILIAFNVMHKEELLGTYDSKKEARREKRRLLKSSLQVFVMKRYDEFLI